MPRLRPPLNVRKFGYVAAAILLLPWPALVDAQLQQRQESPLESFDSDAIPTIEATKIPQQLEAPLTPGRRKNTLSVNNNKLNKNDASAIATLAPAESAVAAPPARPPSATAGLTSPHIARSLEDWEVEDFVLLATVDGKLHARDRKTGRERWELAFERPMVETKYHRRNQSKSIEDYQHLSIDEYLWAVEPSQDGRLYIFRGGPDPGLVHTGLTMKKLVEELAPYGDEDPHVMYTGTKETSMMTVDARTGKVINFFGTKVGQVNPGKSCTNSNNVLDDKGECGPGSTLTIGRTEYTVSIHGRKDGHPIADLTFYEWSPNNYDQDLNRQYHTTLDNKYIYTSHDGAVFGFDHARSNMDEPGPLFKTKFSSPVVRVFDIARQYDTDKSDAELIMLPQPMPPTHDDEISAHQRASNIFLNHTEDGSWYAMSGKSYPLVVEGTRLARCNQQDWVRLNPSWWDIWNDGQLSEALVGLHSIENSGQERLLAISAPSDDNNQTDNSFPDMAPALMGAPTLQQRFYQIPTFVANTFVDLVKNPILLLILIAFVISRQREIRTFLGQISGGKEVQPKLEAPVQNNIPNDGRLPEIPENDIVEIPAVSGDATPQPPQAVEAVEQNVEVTTEKPAAAASLDITGQEKPAASPEKTKKAHRGRRGGVKHKKGPRAISQDHSQDGNPPKPPPTVEDAVRDAQNLGQQTKLEPDIHTISSDPAEVSGPIIRIGALEVNTDKLIGTGSNGTMVFEGNFDGREVAVKRMLIQFFDIASQETKLLRESDDHPNVIRYYAQQQAAGFLYIALELCPASLADVIEKPQLHRALAQGGEKDLPNVLYQITNGLQHLHNLRIVHRDLKPQNILVSMGKDGKPRMLVSDFGLCKKLEGEQSSFRATTAHAAGTSGWRAPELLLDDDANQGSAMVDASTDGNSGSAAILSPELMPNRRATRAIDIFSLGLVFFYVLTKGSHPFDCGDRYMREVNIRKGNFSLQLLDVLGDYAGEAKDLIESMLCAEPKRRPSARDVLAHPFFWSPKKRLNFLCDVSDHFEKEIRDPPSEALQELESHAPRVCRGDFLKPLGKEFVESMGKQRKYTGTRLLDLLRALRNKKNHYEDMSDKLKKDVGPLPDGYLSYWTRKFPNLLITCWNVVYEVRWDDTDRFREYYMPAIPGI